MAKSKKGHGCLVDLFLSPFYLVFGGLALIFSLIFEIVKAIFGTKNNNNTKNFIPVQSEITNGHEYEYFVAEYLRRTGYSQVEVTKGSSDFGVDVVATKDKIKYAVQCKYYSSPVNLKAVQEVVAGAPLYGCDAAMVVTNNTFTKSAVELAAANGVILLPNINKMPQIINEQKPKNSRKAKWIMIAIFYTLSTIALIGMYYSGLDTKDFFKYIGFEILILAILVIIDLVKRKRNIRNG